MTLTGDYFRISLPRCLTTFSLFSVYAQHLLTIHLWASAVPFLNIFFPSWCLLLAQIRGNGVSCCSLALQGEVSQAVLVPAFRITCSRTFLFSLPFPLVWFPPPHIGATRTSQSIVDGMSLGCMRWKVKIPECFAINTVSTLMASRHSMTDIFRFFRKKKKKAKKKKGILYTYVIHP